MVSSEEKQQLRQLLHTAGESLLSYWPGNQSVQELGVQVKADGSYVSEADLASNSILTAGLEKLFPNDGIHSEEATIEAAQWTQSRVWIIDPLDGTDVFLRGKDEFSILLALTEAGRSLLGFMHFPARQLLLEAEQGQGAFCNVPRCVSGGTVSGVSGGTVSGVSGGTVSGVSGGTVSGVSGGTASGGTTTAESQGQRLSVSKNQLPRLRGVYARNCILNNPDVVYPERLDSGHAFLMLLQGELDAIAFRLDKLREWDLAAPSIIIEEAGG